MNRSKKELYIILLDYYKLGTELFICNCILECFENRLFNYDEYSLIKKDFRQDNKPSSELHPEFYNHELWLGKYGWWRANGYYQERGNFVRIQFLQKLIDINS